MKTIVLCGDDLDYAVQVLGGGGVVALPTETVYGFAGNAYHLGAIEAIYRLKGRPSEKPLSLLVSDVDMATRVCDSFPKAAQRLAEAFWPGPLTIVLPCRDDVPSVVTAGGSTVGVRCPDHALTLNLLKLFGTPLAAPSANPSGFPAPNTTEGVLAYFDGKIACVIDGGVCAMGIPSTVISLVGGQCEILRRGALSEEDISSCLEMS